MTDARALLETAKVAMAETDRAIRNHPFVAATASGQVDVSALQRFAGNQYQMWRYNTTDASMVRFADHPYRDVFLTPPEVEAGAARGFASLASAFGLEGPELERFEPDAAAFGYAGYKAWLICYGTAAEMACARALNLEAWGFCCGLLVRGLREHYGCDEDQTRFLEFFVDIEDVETQAAKVIDEDLANGVEAYRILRAARMMQDYEKQFWDAMTRLSERSETKGG